MPTADRRMMALALLVGSIEGVVAAAILSLFAYHGDIKVGAFVTAPILVGAVYAMAKAVLHYRSYREAEREATIQALLDA